jgi:MazG family protein
MKRATIDNLLDIMRRLRDPDGGCPWDQEQTFETIAPYTIEEAYEVIDAIDRGDLGDLRDELGDLLLQVVYHAQMADEAGAFGFDAVVESICDKMVRRHPHVFAGARVENATEQTAAWEQAKLRERVSKARTTAGPESRLSILDGSTVGLPPLLRALDLQKRAAAVGFDWPDAAGAILKVREESDELVDALQVGAAAEVIRDEVGDLLFSCVNVARKLGIDPDAAMRVANAKFERRVRKIESILQDSNEGMSDASAERLDALWNRVKEIER